MTSGLPSLEDLFAGRSFADVPASPLQRGICRAADGARLDGVLADEELERHFGTADVPALLPIIVVLVCGVRAGKSFLTACALLRCVLRVDLSGLKGHELPRAVIVAPRSDNAEATLRILIGIVESSPLLRRMLVGEPKAESITLRRHDGREVDVFVVPASRGGIALRSRWLVFAALEEVAGFAPEKGGAVVNAEDQFGAATTRILPGGQVWLPSSPFGPEGLLYEMYRDHFGAPGSTLVVHAPTLAMNPSFSAAQVEDVRRRRPDVAAREYDAQWLDADTAFLSSAQVDAATRTEPLELEPSAGLHYVAAMDPAAKANAWTLVVGHRTRALAGGYPRFVVDVATQWIGSRSSPLSPEAVFRQMAALLRPFGVNRVYSDSWNVHGFKDLAHCIGLVVVECPTSAALKLERYGLLAAAFEAGAIELAPHPDLVGDLKRLRRRAAADRIRVDEPRTPDGRHCDFAPALALAVEKSPSSQPLRFDGRLGRAITRAFRSAGDQWGPLTTDWGDDPHDDRDHSLRFDGADTERQRRP